MLPAVEKSRWMIEKKISFGDLATIVLIFASGFGYVIRNETDKTKLVENQIASDKRFEDYRSRQNETDKSQDTQIKDGLNRIEARLETFNSFLLMQKGR